MYARVLTTAVFVVVNLLAITLRGEIPDLDPGTLYRISTSIVVGKANAIYGYTEKSRQYETTKYVAEILIFRVEKGDGLKTGQLVYARFWRKETIGDGDIPVGPGGHRGIPGIRDIVRVYLQRNNDGGLDVVLPNGFELIEKAK